MEKHSKIINLIKAIIIVTVAVTIVIGLSRILLLKSEDGISQLQSLYKQPEDTIDVIFAGSSKVYCDIATGVLWDNYGIAAYDLGGAEAPSWVSYYHLKEALKTQKPKVICYEVTVAAMYDMLYQSNTWAPDNNYGMKWNSNRIDQLRVNSEEDEFWLRLNPFNIMHGRYNDLNRNDFENIRNSVNYKGFDPRENVDDMDRPDISSVTGTTPCTEKEEEYIRKIIELAKSEGITPVFFASPYDVPESEQEKINYVRSIAESEGVDFLDFDTMWDEFGMNYETDMADPGHLNYSGNYKFTKYFGSILKDKYNVPDHRGDSRYISWDWDAALQNYERNDLNIINSEDAMDALYKINENYIVFMINGGAGSIVQNNEVIATQDGQFRMTYETDDDVFLFTKKLVKGKDCYSLYINDKEYCEEYANVVIIYDTVRHEYVKAFNY